LILLPEIILTVGALVLLTIDFALPRLQRLTVYIAAIFSGLALCAVGLGSGTAFGSFFSASALTNGFSVLILLGSVIAIVMAMADHEVEKHWGSYFALMLFATVGCLLLIKARDFLYAFLAVELISISSFILTGFERKIASSMEGALKYFLVGAFSAAIALYGISLYYAALGTTSFSFPADIGASANGTLYFAALLLIFVSFGFKASIVPFHFWVPDAYESAPTPITAYLSVVPKLATLGAMINVFNLAIPAGDARLSLALAILACLTMTVGNLSAIAQSNLKRLLAYSSIAQAGYMMIGLLSVSQLGMTSILVYGFSYLLMNFGAFACAQWVATKHGSYDISSCDGLSMRHFPHALAFTLFLLSLAGIPPLVGFIGKYLVFSSAIEGKWAWVAVVAVLNSVISVYYYMRIAYRMYFVETKSVVVSAPVLNVFGGYVLSGVIAVLLIGTLFLGIYPNPLLTLVRF